MGRGLILTMVMACAAAAGAPAGAELVWRSPPAAGAGHGHGGQQGRSAPVLYLEDGAGAEVELWKPDLKRDRVVSEGADGRFVLRPTGLNNYHLLVASRRTGAVAETALRYVYHNGKPTGVSPSRLTAAQKAPLEIVPAPLPREHRRYLGGLGADFDLRFEGQPVAGTRLALSTANGTRAEGVTDASGRVRFTLPDDFARVRPGRRRNPPADFVLRAEYAHGGVLYRTTLSGPYYVNPSHWRSTGAGVLALAAGFVAGTLVLRLGRGGTGEAGR